MGTMSRDRRRGRKLPPDFSLDPPELPTEGKKAHDPIHLAYCPLAEKSCSNVQCEACSLVDEAFPGGLWVCSVCAEGLRILPYYGNGSCELCGFESGVLLLGKAE